MKKKFYPSSATELFFLLFLSILITVPTVYFEVSGLLSGFSSEIFSFLFFFIVITSITYLKNKRRGISLFDGSINSKSFFSMPLMIFLLLVFIMGVMRPINYHLRNFEGYHNYLKELPRNLTFHLGAVILAPVIEEIIFRGIILRGCLSTYSPKISIILSSIIFGLCHGTPIKIWGSIIIGLFLGWIYFRTKNLGLTIILHFVANFYISLEFYLVSNLLKENKEVIFSVYLIPISVIIIFFAFKRLIKKMEGIKVSHKEFINKSAFFPEESPALKRNGG